MRQLRFAREHLSLEHSHQSSGKSVLTSTKTVPHFNRTGAHMKRFYLLFAAVVFTSVVAISVSAQVARPTATPVISQPRPTPTPAAQPRPTPAPANAPVPPSKIAVIDTSMFGDEKNGIFRYVDAARSVANEFRVRTDEVQNLEKRLTTLATEIENLMKATPVNKQVVDAKQQQGQDLQIEYNAKKATFDGDLSKRSDQVVSPISRQIGAALDQFAT